MQKGSLTVIGDRSGSYSYKGGVSSILDNTHIVISSSSKCVQNSVQKKNHDLNTILVRLVMAFYVRIKVS